MKPSRLVFALLFLFSSYPLFSQPDIKYYERWIQIEGGYNRFVFFNPRETPYGESEDIAPINAISLYAESSLSYDGGFGSRIGVTVGQDYWSFSPIGILTWIPKLFWSTYTGIENPYAQVLVGLLGLSALQFPIPVSEYGEITLGYDAFKFTKAKVISDSMYITGSLNASMSFYITDNLFFQAFYEFNHTHNFAINLLNYIDVGA